MSLTNIVLVVVLIACCCILQSQSLKCFVCQGKQNCQKPPLLECNQTLANTTSNYLNKHRAGINVNSTSTKYECIKENVIFTSGLETYYKGCIYFHINGCVQNLRQNYTAKSSQCVQCLSKNGCNPAGRTTGDVMTVITTITAVIILRFAWK